MDQPVTNRLSAGFTLTELVIVIALISILAVSVLTQWPGRSLNLDGLAHQLAGDIRYVQSLSMTRGQRFRIEFSNDRYNMKDQAGATIAHPVVGATDVLLDPAVGLSTTNVPNGYLVFDGKGAPFEDDNLPGDPLAGDAEIELSIGTDARKVVVSRETGRVLVQ